MPGSWLTCREACAYLGCSRQTLYREIRTGKLSPDGRVGRRPRFSVAALELYVCRGTPCQDSLEQSAGKEGHHAHLENSANAHGATRCLARRPGQIPGDRDVERRTHGPTEETRSSGKLADRGSGVAGGAARQTCQPISFEAALQRLQRAMGRSTNGSAAR